MDDRRDLKALTEIFRELGANSPEEWARSQIDEDVPQLARYLFLRQAWRSIVSESDPSWLESAITRARSHPDEPYAGAGLALAGLRAKGATEGELTDLVRAMQAQLPFGLCHLLEDPGDVEESVSDIAWVLVQVDEEGRPLGAISGLHESVLETDPTGREMRSRPGG